jgi:hypothetical protein
MVMRDPVWRQAWAAVIPHIRKGDKLLLPLGEWPQAPGQARFYGATVELRDANLFILHKGMLGGIRKPALRQVLTSWHFIFANDVFVCFRKPWLSDFRRPQGHNRHPHVCKLHEYIHSEKLKRIAPTLFYPHLPKAAGTSVYTLLSQRALSSIYYPSFETFLFNPPDPGEYDLVCGHVPLPLMAARATPNDHIVTLMREPTARFRSAFLHSRRAQEDPATFSPVMRAMRTTRLADFLATHDGQMELRQQLLMLGFDFGRNYTQALDGELLAAATRRLRDPACLVHTTDSLAPFITAVTRLLNINASPAEIPATNATPTAKAADISEFEAQLGVVRAGNRAERDLYEEVRKTVLF